jgi:hypothetical protein
VIDRSTGGAASEREFICGVPDSWNWSPISGQPAWHVPCFHPGDAMVEARRRIVTGYLVWFMFGGVSRVLGCVDWMEKRWTTSNT